MMLGGEILIKHNLRFSNVVAAEGLILRSVFVAVNRDGGHRLP